MDSQETIELINGFEQQIQFIQKELHCGIISRVDAASKIEDMTKKEFKFKESLAKKYHRTKDGTLRKISPPDDKHKYWRTKFPRSQNKTSASTYEGLIEKIYAYYTNTPNDLSFGCIFHKALEEKARTDNVKNATIQRYEEDYSYFVTDELTKKSIRQIKTPFLSAYTQARTKELFPGKKRLEAFHSILKLTFRYALCYELIERNPLDGFDIRRYYPDCKIKDKAPENNIFSPEEVDKIAEEVRQRISSHLCGGYYVNGFITLFNMEAGPRIGETCALKWCDIRNGSIHFHSQIVKDKKDGKTIWVYQDSTKNERRVSKGGRYFPLSPNIEELLEELKTLQESFGIESEYIFCKIDGSYSNPDGYNQYFSDMMKKLHLKCGCTNNHALRKTFNSNVLVPAGIPVADRAAMLGHTPETNERNYTFEQRDYLERSKKALDTFYKKTESTSQEVTEPPVNSTVSKVVTPRSPQNIIEFRNKKRPRALS